MVGGWAREHTTWTAALLGLRRAVEAAGILVVINGVVGNNTDESSIRLSFEGLCELARLFKVSPMVTARRSLDLGLIDWNRFDFLSARL